MKIASIQLDIIWENKKENLKRIADFVLRAQKEGCDLIIFPEMFNSGFSMNSVAISEEENGVTTQLLSELASNYKINVIAGITEKQDQNYYNIALVFNRLGQVVSKYIKNYPYSNAGEDQYYQAGNKHVLFYLDGIKSSIFICYDLRFPELFRKVAKQVQLIIVIASWPETRQDHWISLLKARAIENQCFVVGVNRIGVDGNGLKYIGGSQVFDPLGINVSAGSSDQEYLVTTLDMPLVEEVREELPFLHDIK